MAQIIEPVHPLLGVHKRPATHSLLPLDVYGYDEQEYYVSGTAAQGEPFKTRILVRAPSVANKFNGIVIVEWLNVTAGHELEVVSPSIRDLMLEEGFAWLGVSAQPLGVAWMRNWDPERYGTLEHPDIPDGPLPEHILFDTHSDTIFEQIGVAIRAKAEMLFGYKARHLIATGCSQSSLRLNMFVNGPACSPGTYEGVFLWNGPGPQPITNDKIKVIALNSEMEVGWALSAFNGEPTQLGMTVPKTDTPHPPEDTANFRLYEIAGAGHSPYPSLAEMQARSQFNTAGTQKQPEGPASDFGYPIQPDHMVGEAALVALIEWISDGVEPPHADRISIVIGQDGKASIEQDEFGNTKGGVRLPGIDVPLGRSVGVNGPDPFRNGTRGGFVPFDSNTIKDLYPSKDAYVSAFEKAAKDMVAKRLLRPSDAETLVTEAGRVEFP